jgi:hypothetical protein
MEGSEAYKALTWFSGTPATIFLVTFATPIILLVSSAFIPSMTPAPRCQCSYKASQMRESVPARRLNDDSQWLEGENVDRIKPGIGVESELPRQVLDTSDVVSVGSECLKCCMRHFNSGA